MSPLDIATLQTRLSQLEQENEALRCRLAQQQEQDWQKQIAIAREQEEAAQQRAAELAKANEALQATIDAMAAIDDLDEFVPAVLRIVAQTFQAKDCAFYEHNADEIVYLRYWLYENRVLIPEEVLAVDGDRFATVRRLADGFTVPDSHLGTSVRDRTRAVILDHRVATSVPEFHAFACRNGWHLELNVPLVVDGYAEGALVIYRPAEEPFTPGEVALAESLGKQLALAMQANRLATEGKSKAVEAAIAREQEQAAQQRAAELERINTALGASLHELATKKDIDHFLEDLLMVLSQNFGSPNAMLFTFDEIDNTATIVAAVEAGQVLPNGESSDPFPAIGCEPINIKPIIDYFYATRSLWFLDTYEAAQIPISEVMAWHQRRGHREAVGVPLFAGDDLIGLIGFAFQEKYDLTSFEIEFVKSLAAQATLAIQLTRLAEEAKQAAIAREQEQAAQERATELAVINDELKQRDRLLSVVAQITKDLLEVEAIDVAIPAALQAVGEVAEMSRVLLVIEFQDPETQTLHHQIVYEWVAEGIQRSLGFIATHNATFQSLVEVLYQGQSWWGLVADLPDVTRREFEALDILSTGVVPIFFEGRYIGCVAFDDCVNVRQWNQQEIDVLKAAAESIGAALHRKQLVDRLIAERLRAEQTRAAELAKANEVLRRSLNTLVVEQTLPGFLGHVLTSITQQLNSPSSDLWLYDREQRTATLSLVFNGQTVKLAQQSHHPHAHIPCDYADPAIAWAWEDIIQQQQSHLSVIAKTTRIPLPQRDYLLRQGIWGILSIPLVLGDRTEGTFAIHFHSPRQFRDEELELVQTLANQAALAIQMAQLAEQAKEAALLEERNRLAGEIHDTLAQAFTGISMQLSVAKWLLQQDPIAVDGILDRINDIAQSGLAEARRSVWTLYPVEPAYADLAQQLSRCVKQMTSGTAMQVDVQISGSPCPLSPLVGKNLLRIGQEAITNTLKHASATVLKIHLIYGEQSLCLCVQDNGCGFLPDSNPTGFGLISMSDRADRIGGQLTINSQPGQGTETKIQVPLP